MRLDGAYIPYGGYWSSPFVKWQGSLANEHPLELAAACARQTLAARGIEPSALSSLVLGFTVPSPHCFYGAPWVAALLGAPKITGPTVMQACATGVRCIATAASAVASGADPLVLALAADRTSNGPHLYYPNPSGPGGRGAAEDWVWDNFNFDPVAKNAMVTTAENIARAEGFSRQAQEELTLLRYAQYGDALKDGAAFHRRYLLSPLKLKGATVESDEGIFPTTPAGLAKLKPVVPDGTVTFGTQTHPADGNAGLIVTTQERARTLSKEGGPIGALISFAQANAPKGFMAQAVASAAHLALADARWSVEGLRIKTHNPFAVNDLLLARALDIDAASFNHFGSALVYGHPQGPTGIRGVIELIEELAQAGGGRGLFAGCAAGDTAAAICVEVDGR